MTKGYTGEEERTRLVDGNGKVRLDIIEEFFLYLGPDQKAVTRHVYDLGLKWVRRVCAAARPCFFSCAH